MMKKRILLITVISGALLVSCNSNKKNNQVSEVDVVESVVRTTVTDNQGNTMVLAFYNESGTAIAELNGEAINMVRDTTASGVKMHNNEYEYEEWQGHIVLKKDGKVVFDNKDVVSASVTNKQGEKLDMTFNNNNNTAVLKLDGKEINLKADTTASGIKYSNANYVYEEWQGHSVLKKDGKVVFDNKK
ncbi:MliC family protein [Bacteroides sp. 519]|uniref:MliC family protein n=1 Tax=Bacteroides sp. 519 TaxID=2302937 RepID=UPI0013D18242|nr:MliC family protein [Bacteroides sp. 519]